MPGNYTPDELAQLQQYLANAGSSNGYGSINVGGKDFSTLGVSHNDEGGTSYTPNALVRFIPGNGDAYYVVDPNTGQETLVPWDKGGNLIGSSLTDLGKIFASFAAMYAGGAGLAGLTGAAGAAGAAGGAGGATAAGGSGAFLGEGIPSGISAWDGALANAIPAGTAASGAGVLSSAASNPGTTAGTDIFGGNGMTTGFTDTGTAGGALDTGYAGSGAVTGLTGTVSPSTATTAKNILDTVKDSGIVGPAASIIGAIAGSQPVKQTSTQQRDIPDWLKPYVTGPGGLLDGASQLFKQQTAPGAMPGYQQMQNVGMGLLAQPTAGNGFQQFAQRPRFGAGGY